MTHTQRPTYLSIALLAGYGHSIAVTIDTLGYSLLSAQHVHGDHLEQLARLLVSTDGLVVLIRADAEPAGIEADPRL